MATKTIWHRYESKLRHCHPMYSVFRGCRTFIDLAMPISNNKGSNDQVIVYTAQWWLWQYGQNIMRESAQYYNSSCSTNKIQHNCLWITYSFPFTSKTDLTSTEAAWRTANIPVFKVFTTHFTDYRTVYRYFWAYLFLLLSFSFLSVFSCWFCAVD